MKRFAKDDRNKRRYPPFTRRQRKSRDYFFQAWEFVERPAVQWWLQLCAASDMRDKLVPLRIPHLAPFELVGVYEDG
jgi:hypothetical protein